MATAKHLQLGRRRELLDKIAELTNTEEQAGRSKKLSSPQIHQIYGDIVGENSNWKRDKMWHARKIVEELGMEPKTRCERLNLEQLQAVKSYYEDQEKENRPWFYKINPFN